jgi:hypothetical protein
LLDVAEHAAGLEASRRNNRAFDCPKSAFHLRCAPEYDTALAVLKCFVRAFHVARPDDDGVDAHLFGVGNLGLGGLAETSAVARTMLARSSFAMGWAYSISVASSLSVMTRTCSGASQSGRLPANPAHFLDAV